jgi:hypothetical protein
MTGDETYVIRSPKKQVKQLAATAGDTGRAPEVGGVLRPLRATASEDRALATEHEEMAREAEK